MTDPMLTAGVRRIAQDRYADAWADRVMVANIASILDGRGYSTVQAVPLDVLDAVFADNTFAACACDADALLDLGTPCPCDSEIL